MGRPPQYEYSHFVGLSVSWYIHIESNIAVVYGGLPQPRQPNPPQPLPNPDCLIAKVDGPG